MNIRSATSVRLVGALGVVLALLQAAPLCAAVPAGCSLQTVRGVRVLRLAGSPRDRGYAHGYLLASEIMGLFRRYMSFVVRDAGRYESWVRKDIRERFEFPRGAHDEIAGMLAGMRERLGDDGLTTQFNRPLDELDLLAVQALPDWYPIACSAFVIWDDFAPDGPIAGRNMDFFVHPVLLENHILIVQERGEGTQAFVSLAWPSMIGVLTGLSERGVAAFILDAAPTLPTSATGFLPRTFEARRVVEYGGETVSAQHAHELLKDVPTRWGGCLFVAGPQAGGIEGGAGVLERDVRGTSLRAASFDPVLDGVPAFACTNHFRLRAEPIECDRYRIIANRLTRAYMDKGVFTWQDAFSLLLEARQQITLQSMVVNLKTRDVWVKLARPTERIEDAKPVQFTAAELFGAR